MKNMNKNRTMIIPLRQPDIFAKNIDNIKVKTKYGARMCFKKAASQWIPQHITLILAA